MNGLKAVTVSEDCHDMRPIIGKCMTHFVTRCMLTLAVSLTSIDTPAEEQANPDKGNVASTTVANSEANAFFETKIRPLLAEHCYECHGEDEQESGLRVDSLSRLLRGGEGYGAAIVPGNPDGSILISAVKHQELTMPPEKKLSTRQIGDLIQWVKMGAPWPGSAEEHQVAESHRSMEITEDDRAWWSYQPVLQPTIPPIGTSLQTSNPIDAFIRAKLVENGLSPSGMATKRELIRRATFDLTGLPPTPEEVEAFLDDQNPNAYPQLIDRLLDSPHYGERWGRHWLDLIRYAQTNGYERDDEKPFAWRYRDYVIRSFNQDKPFNQFVVEQLAGDELPEVNDDSIIATAFYRFCVWDDEPDDISQAVFDGYDDMLATTSRALLGLSIGCARCHEHKFDPLPHEDYYRMLAFIRNVNYYLKPEGEQRNIVVVPLPGGGETLGVTERSGLPRPTHVLLRGRVATPGKEVEPGFPQVLSQSKANKANNAAIPSERSGNDKSTGRRLALARWIASDDNPLTPRVLVNRLWHYHFGRGIVATPSDFGKTGIPPTHPELLDYLAATLIESNWQLKPLHKQIMLSAAYRQSSRATDPDGLAVDPENNLLWRQNVRRLEAEAIRDAVLATSGQLNLTAGGRGFYPQLPAQVIGSQSMPGRGWGKSSPAERNRRSVYVYAKRSLQLPLLEVFDVASTEQSIAARSRTTVAPQALGLLNSDFITRQADCFAQRLQREATADGPGSSSGVEREIRRAYMLALGRAPSDDELRITADYYDRQLDRFIKSEQAYQLAPALPAALHKTFLDKCRGIDFYKDPMPDWTYQRGDWPGRGDNIHWVRLARGPVAFSEKAALQDGAISCEVKLHPNAEFSSLVFRGRAEGETWQGYELYLDPQNQSAELRRVGERTVAIAKAEARLIAGRWEQIDVAFQSSEIDISLNGEPLFQINDEHPLTGNNRVGLRSWGAELAFRNFVVRDNFQSVEIKGNPPKLAQERALAAVAKLIFNLNEFVYID